jgi:hypothetical protein
MVATPAPQDDASRLARLEALVANLIRKNLFSAVIGAGGITVNGGGGITVNGGKIVIGPGGSIQLPAGGTINDAVGNILFSADSLTGQRLSTPFLAIPMIPKWTGGALQTNTAVGDYTIPASSVTSETTLWQGFVPQVLHPKMACEATIGRVSGTTSTPTYRMYLAGTLIGTWSQTAYAFFETPDFDITGASVYGGENAFVTLTMQADVTSADALAFTCNLVRMSGN